MQEGDEANGGEIVSRQSVVAVAMRLKSFNLLNAILMRQRNDPSQAEHDVPLNQSAQRGQATTLLRCRKEHGRPLIGYLLLLLRPRCCNCVLRDMPKLGSD
jgi:hypothetical protein